MYRPFAISTTDYKDTPIAVKMDCKKSDRFICSFHFTNKDNQDYYLLDRHTPFEGFFSPFITVTESDGTQLDYEGAIAERYYITKKELVHLQAGTTKSVSVEVSSAYNFNGNGIYTIHYNTPLVYMSENEFSSLQESDIFCKAKLSSIPLQISEDVLVENTANFPMTAKQLMLEKEESLKKSNVKTEKCKIGTITGGSNSMIAQVRKAHELICSDKGIYNARHYAYHQDIDLYRKWFGTGRGAYDIFDDMSNAVDWGTVSYDLTNNTAGCLNSYVHGWTTHGGRLVYLCDDFFEYPQGCQSDPMIFTQEGTLIHEWSRAIGYTEDHAIGSCHSLNLAKTHPQLAVENADSYSLFYCDAKT